MRNTFSRLCVLSALFGVLALSVSNNLDPWADSGWRRFIPGQEPALPSSSPSDPLASELKEARFRARVLHETFHGVLQVMHRDFFRKDETRSIPSHSLTDVFAELAKLYSVELAWLAVDLKAMSRENEPETEFEKAAAVALGKGAAEFEQVTDDRFYFASRIRLSGTCLGCHAPSRTNNQDRFAGLVIVMPLKPGE